MKSILLIFFFAFHTVLLAQTVGISEVTAVESKVTLYENNEEKINQIRQKIPELENQWRNNISNLKSEIATLNKERDNLIADMKVGARCSQCGGWKSDFEKRGENFEKHLGDVKGYAVPAKTSEIEATRKSFSEKIAIKKVQLQNLEKGDKEILKQYSEIEEIKKTNETLCREITQHSKNYEKNVLNDAYSKHNIWFEDVLASGTKALIESSKKTLIRVKKGWLEKEYSEKSIAELKLIKEKNVLQQEKNKQGIAENELKVSDLETEQKQRTEYLQEELDELFKAISEVEDKIKAENNESMKDQLNDENESLNKKVVGLREKMAAYIVKSKQDIEGIKEKKKELSVEITQLISNLGKQQEQKTKELKEELDQKLADLKRLESESEIAYKYQMSEYDKKLNQYKQKQDIFIKEITRENNRMLLAVKKINCPMWNETSGKVALNWNKKLPCVNIFSFPETLMIQEVLGTSACSNESFFQNGTSTYKSFFEGLQAEEKRVLVK